MHLELFLFISLAIECMPKQLKYFEYNMFNKYN